MNNDVIVKEIREVKNSEVKKIVSLHMSAFPKFFLTQLGSSFLETLYKGYLEDDNSGIIIAEENMKIIGFIAYSNDYPKFYKMLIKRHLIRFALCSMIAAIKHPSFIMRLLRAFKKSDSVTKKEKYVELASICVDPSLGNRGVGSLLIDYLKSIVDFNKFKFINLETDADNNDTVNSFYIKNGFQLERQFVTPEGRRMNEYRYLGKA